MRNGLWTRRRSKWLIFRLFLSVPYTASPSKWSYDNQEWGSFNPRSWVIQWRLSADGEDPIRERFLVGLLLYVMMQSLIAWSNEYSWHQLPTLSLSWTILVSVLGQSGPTFSFFTSPVCPLHCAMSRTFYFVQCPKHQGILEWPSYLLDCVAFPGSPHEVDRWRPVGARALPDPGRSTCKKIYRAVQRRNHIRPFWRTYITVSTVLQTYCYSIIPVHAFVGSVIVRCKGMKPGRVMGITSCIVAL